jgi:hypothetical protein
MHKATRLEAAGMSAAEPGCFLAFEYEPRVCQCGQFMWFLTRFSLRRIET